MQDLSPTAQARHGNKRPELGRRKRGQNEGQTIPSQIRQKERLAAVLRESKAKGRKLKSRCGKNAQSFFHELEIRPAQRS
jgi:hypothetical protein